MENATKYLHNAPKIVFDNNNLFIKFDLVVLQKLIVKELKDKELQNQISQVRHISELLQIDKRDIISYDLLNKSIYDIVKTIRSSSFVVLKKDETKDYLCYYPTIEFRS